MATSAIPKPLNCDEAVIAFESAATSRSRLKAFISQDVLALQALADSLARAVREIAVLFAGLDTARRVANAKGQALPSSPFIPAETDEYALVEALFWDRLSDEAEVLLKTLLRQALREVAP
jgi:hypothetical protein